MISFLLLYFLSSIWDFPFIFFICHLFKNDFLICLIFDFLPAFFSDLIRSLNLLFSHFSHLLQLQMWHAALPSLDSRLQKVSSTYFWRLLFSSLKSLKIFLMTVLSPVEDVTCAIHTATSSPNWTSQELRTFLRLSHVIPIVKRLWSHQGMWK